MRSGSAGCAAARGLRSRQIAVLPFPAVLHVNQHVALEAEVSGTPAHSRIKLLM